MTDLTQTIADAAEEYVNEHATKVTGFRTELAFTAGANLILPMLDAERAKAKKLEDDQWNDAAKIVELATKLTIATDALDFYAKHHHHMHTTSPNFAREALANCDK